MKPASRQKRYTPGNDARSVAGTASPTAASEVDQGGAEPQQGHGAEPNSVGIHACGQRDRHTLQHHACDDQGFSPQDIAGPTGGELQAAPDQ